MDSRNPTMEEILDAIFQEMSRRWIIGYGEELGYWRRCSFAVLCNIYQGLMHPLAPIVRQPQYALGQYSFHMANSADMPHEILLLPRMLPISFEHVRRVLPQFRSGQISALSHRSCYIFAGEYNVGNRRMPVFPVRDLHTLQQRRPIMRYRLPAGSGASPIIVISGPRGGMSYAHNLSVVLCGIPDRYFTLLQLGLRLWVRIIPLTSCGIGTLPLLYVSLKSDYEELNTGYPSLSWYDEASEDQIMPRLVISLPHVDHRFGWTGLLEPIDPDITVLITGLSINETLVALNQGKECMICIDATRAATIDNMPPILSFTMTEAGNV